MIISNSKNLGNKHPLVLSLISCLIIIITTIDISPVGCMDKMCDSLEVNAEHPKQKVVVVYQPSHQTDTGKNFNEALTCNTIVDAAIKYSSGKLNLNKVWSFNTSELHHARAGSNTKIAHTSAVYDGKISGYPF